MTNLSISREQALRTLSDAARAILAKRYPYGAPLNSIIDAMSWPNPEDFEAVDCPDAQCIDGYVEIDGPMPWSAPREAECRTCRGAGVITRRRIEAQAESCQMADFIALRALDLLGGLVMIGAPLLSILAFIPFFVGR